MANTEGGTVVLGVRDDGVPVGHRIRDKRELVEQMVINAATENCQPMIVPRLDWEYFSRTRRAAPSSVLIIGIPASAYEVHQTADGRYLQRIGSHRRPIPGPQLARLLSSRRSGGTGGGDGRFVGAAVADLDEVRLRRYFLRRFPGLDSTGRLARDPDRAQARSRGRESRPAHLCRHSVCSRSSRSGFFLVHTLIWRSTGTVTKPDGNAVDRKRFDRAGAGTDRARQSPGFAPRL